MKKPLVIIAGATAVGKTGLSIELAKRLNAEIISADSMQIYRMMDIGTAKIMPHEMEGVKHYLIDELDPKEEFNIVEFKMRAKQYIDDIHSRGKIPMIVGGTGFYIQAVLYDIDFCEMDNDSEYREQLLKLKEEIGTEGLHAILKEKDPKSAEHIHPNDLKRILRALEYYKLTGESISVHNENEAQKESPYNAAYFVLNKERETLYEDINRRIDIMLENGLVDEVKALMEYGCTKEMISMQGLGYKEIIRYLEGECSLDDAVFVLKRDTRHFAKRQLTWFKRERNVIWVDKDKENEPLDFIINKLKEQNIINF